MRATHVGAVVGLALAVCNCSERGPAVVTTSALSLQRVVVYRNGVGYFERRGRVQGDHVEFRVLPSEVGDFLATLAVMEAGGSSVRSAAFPMPTEVARRVPALADRRRTVRLALDGQTHDLVVGYMVETPIWRPSYRMVYTPRGAQIQAWGIVQNVSGEDWTNVRLSLVAGAPVAFRSELAEMVISPRPLVTDRGEVIDAVPRGETTLADEPASAPAAGGAPAPVVPGVAGNQPVEAALAQAEAAATPTAATGASAPSMYSRQQARYAAPRRAYGAAGYGADFNGALNERGSGAAPTGTAPMTATPRSVASLAAVAQQGGVSRYDLPNAVTIPNQSATMVLLIARDVPGEQIYLFSPDPGVADSVSHPFHVARFENRTGALLERGPVAIFETGNFLGQGMLDPLPDGATATVPFALERALSVETSQTNGVEGARLTRVWRDQLTLERYNVVRHTYRLRNGLDHEVRVMVRLPLDSNMTVFEPPAGTESPTGSALIPVSVPQRGRGEQLVQTRVPFSLTATWSDPNVAEAVESFLRDGHPAPEVATALRAALTLVEEINTQTTEHASQTTQRDDLMVNTEETRANLEALRNNSGAGDLRGRLTARLADNATRINAITRRIVELDTGISERRVRLSETVRTLQFDVAATPATPPAPAH